MVQAFDYKYLAYLVKHNGVPQPKEEKIKKIRPIKETDKGYTDCRKLAVELIKKGYNLERNRVNILFSLLYKENVFRRENNKYFINEEFIKEGYFINGVYNKESNVYKIIITKKGIDFIIELLNLKIEPIDADWENNEEYE